MWSCVPLEDPVARVGVVAAMGDVPESLEKSLALAVFPGASSLLQDGVHRGVAGGTIRPHAGSMG